MQRQLLSKNKLFILQSVFFFLFTLPNKLKAIVRILVDHGADCDAQNKYWQTPLHICALSSDSSSADHLINHVTNVDTADEQGLTALHYAVGFY